MNGGEAVVDDSVKNAVNICKFITLSGSIFGNDSRDFLRNTILPLCLSMTLSMAVKYSYPSTPASLVISLPLLPLDLTGILGGRMVRLTIKVLL